LIAPETGDIVPRLATTRPSTQVGHAEPREKAENQAVSERADHQADQDPSNPVDSDPELRLIVATWPALSAEVRARILELIRASE
jgi:hypothetical protein